MDYLFVYGTLLKQFSNGVLKPLETYMQLAGQGQLKGRLYDLGEYPAYIEDTQEIGHVRGEVYKISNAKTVFAVLDDYEGIEYSRKRKLVRLGDNRSIRCWVYVYQQKVSAGHQRIMNGDYIAFYRNKVNNG